MTAPEAPTDAPEEASEPDSGPAMFVPIPSSRATGAGFLSKSTLTPLVCDGRALSRLLEQVINRSGKTISGVAKDLGTSPNNISQYLNGRRQPGMLFFLKVCEICGAKVKIEFP